MRWVFWDSGESTLELYEGGVGEGGFDENQGVYCEGEEIGVFGEVARGL